MLLEYERMDNKKHDGNGLRLSLWNVHDSREYRWYWFSRWGSLWAKSWKFLILIMNTENELIFMKSFLNIFDKHWNSDKWNSDASHACHYWEVVHKKPLCFLSFVAINVRPSLFDDKKLFWTETIVWNLFRIIKHVGIKPKSVFREKIQTNFNFFDPPKIGIQQAIWCLFHEDFHFEQCYISQFVSKSHEKNFLSFLKHQCLQSLIID